MIPTLSEFILILLIMVCIFGLGKLTSIAEKIGELRSQYKRGAEGEPPLDVTPGSQRKLEPSQPKPGTRQEPIEDAQVDKTADGDG